RADTGAAGMGRNEMYDDIFAFGMVGLLRHCKRKRNHQLRQWTVGGRFFKGKRRRLDRWQIEDWQWEGHFLRGCEYRRAVWKLCLRRGSRRRRQCDDSPGGYERHRVAGAFGKR